MTPRTDEQRARKIEYDRMRRSGENREQERARAREYYRRKKGIGTPVMPLTPTRERTERRFWSKIAIRQPTECWLWQGSIRRDGYGHFWLDGSSQRAHRFALTLKLGRAIRAGLLACHTCDNPRCCNPAHLWEGSHKDNSGDAMQKGRHYKSKGWVARERGMLPRQSQAEEGLRHG